MRNLSEHEHNIPGCMPRLNPLGSVPWNNRHCIHHFDLAYRNNPRGFVPGKNPDWIDELFDTLYTAVPDDETIP